jgi:UDP-N-acetylglucosamine--N-acetylmuramyl-(pentapeptide) pyrophosphoryl-undecaprenol N-acetylglucosamine transferase
MRVVVSGGGTGGHIFPAIAVADGLKRLSPESEILYVGGTTGMESQIVPERGLMYQAVTAKKLRKVVSLETVGVVLSLWKGYREAKTYLRAFRAEAVVGTGGYVAAATVLAGARLGLPTLILASDVVAGRTNLWLSRYVKIICVTFAEAAAQFPRGKTVQTGLPLREEIVLPPKVTPQQARCELPGLSAERFTLLVIGGSQGARAVNSVVSEAAPRLLEAGVQILHQTGVKNQEDVRVAAEAKGLLAKPGYSPVAFLEEKQISLAMRAADVIVCRGGISTLSEIMVNGLPAIVVPLPSAYADHQTYNARPLEKAGAALLRPEAELTGDGLAEEILALREAPERLARMSAAMRGLGRPNAAADVAKLVRSLISGTTQ